MLITRLEESYRVCVCVCACVCVSWSVIEGNIISARTMSRETQIKTKKEINKGKGLLAPSGVSFGNVITLICAPCFKNVQFKHTS
jgi:hypothetical protein